MPAVDLPISSFAAILTMSNPARSNDPFSAKSTFNTGSGTAALYRLSKLEDAGLGKISALPFSIRMLAGSGAAELRWLRSDRSRREKSRRLACGEAGRVGDSLQAGPRGVAGFYRRAVRGRSGGHAQRDEAAGRRSEENQSAGAGRFGDRPFDSSRLFRLARMRWI